MAQTPQTTAGGRFKDFETLKLLPRNISSGKSTSKTGRETLKTAKSTTNAGPIRTCHLDSMGLTTSDMTSLKEADIFGDAASTSRSRGTGTPQKYRLDQKHKYLKKIMMQNTKVQKSLNKSH